MARSLILVNGLPGSGKTTLATGLASQVDACLLSKDAVKEALASLLRDPVPVGSSLGAIAMDAAWALARVVPGLVIIESWWFPPRDAVAAETGLRSVGADTVLEIWCDTSASVAEGRYRCRRRPTMFEDERHLVDSWPQWRAEARPLGLSQVLRVDTSQCVDYEALAASVRAALERRDSRH